MNVIQEIDDMLARNAVAFPEAKLTAFNEERLRQIKSYLTLPWGHFHAGVSEKRLPIYLAIRDEREYQDERWGKTASSDRPGNGDRTLDEFALYIAGHADKLTGFCTEFADANTKLHMVRQIAALCVWCMEQHGVAERNMTKTRTKNEITR